MFDLSISPSNNEFFIKPGQKYLLGFNITNNSKTTQTLSTSIEAWLPKDNQGKVSYTNVIADPSITFALNNADLQLGQTFVINPKETKQLVLKITTTPYTNRKDHYFTFFLTQKTEEQISGKIGAHLIITTQEKQDTSLLIKNFKASPLIKDSFLKPIYFSSTVTNNSSQFNKITGKLSISKNNLTIKEFTLSPDVVLGGYSRLVRCADKNAEIIPCALNPPFWPGFYTATLTINAEKPLVAQTTFFVFPYTVFIILGIITAIILITMRTKSKKQ
jgi:hypothetical protein